MGLGNFLHYVYHCHNNLTVPKWSLYQNSFENRECNKVSGGSWQYDDVLVLVPSRLKLPVLLLLGMGRPEMDCWIRKTDIHQCEKLRKTISSSEGFSRFEKLAQQAFEAENQNGKKIHLNINNIINTLIVVLTLSLKIYSYHSAPDSMRCIWGNPTLLN